MVEGESIYLTVEGGGSFSESNAGGRSRLLYSWLLYAEQTWP